MEDIDCSRPADHTAHAARTIAIDRYDRSAGIFEGSDGTAGQQLADRHRAVAR